MQRSEQWRRKFISNENDLRMAEIRLKLSEHTTKQKQLDLELECVKRQTVEHILTTTNRSLLSLSLSSPQSSDNLTDLAYYSDFLNNRIKILDISSFENQSIHNS
ncbi:unnamed protein product [Didymodactylos carnosus]|uniref:Uncharacterized protein n=1 Tax=Didymodactylos carnosus TaxID=1234261 RepID=A0A815L7X2_9BILA|nr:unnamed protein product [Didymodactylos carnosus]CAF1406350.1 unnamed protein product [Didymodactylos carnosus]CAF4017820.1 unnamed protein product [Didymodactylos carnosus]CAF4297555.1 unnamed protein product [Didymodactylos carnosus]